MKGASEITFHLKEKLGKTEFQKLKGNLPYIFDTKACKVYGISNTRFCDFRTGTCLSARSNKSTRHFAIYGNNFDELFEITTMALLSAVGEALDLKGFHRVHAAALQYKNLSALVILPQGGGKSAISTLALKNKNVKIFSDEMPLLKNGNLYPFPLRIALRPNVANALNLNSKSSGLRIFKRVHDPHKITFSIPIEKLASPAHLDFVFFGNTRTEKAKHPLIEEDNSVFAGSSSLIESLVVGRGLAQMSEYVLRMDNLKNILKSGLARIGETFKIKRAAEFFHFSPSENAFENTAKLLNFLETRIDIDQRLGRINRPRIDADSVDHSNGKGFKHNSRRSRGRRKPKSASV